MTPLNLQVSNPKGLYAASIVLFIVGFVLLGVAGMLTWRTSLFVERSESTVGTIVALVPVVSTSDDSNKKTTCAPVFSFKGGDGKTYSIRSTSSNDPPAFNVGDEVAVLYEMSDPMSARINSTFQLWGLPLILGTVGILMVMMASAFTLLLRRLARRSESIPRFRSFESSAVKKAGSEVV